MGVFLLSYSSSRCGKNAVASDAPLSHPLMHFCVSFCVLLCSTSGASKLPPRQTLLSVPGIASWCGAGARYAFAACFKWEQLPLCALYIELVGCWRVCCLRYLGACENHGTLQRAKRKGRWVACCNPTSPTSFSSRCTRPFGGVRHPAAVLEKGSRSFARMVRNTPGGTHPVYRAEIAPTGGSAARFFRYRVNVPRCAP